MAMAALARRSEIEVIAAACRTEDPGFKSRQGVRFFGLFTLHCIALSKLNMHRYCVYLIKINVKK
jgi:hypothetical protein